MASANSQARSLQTHESHVRHTPSQKPSAAFPSRRSHRPLRSHPVPASEHPEKVCPAAAPGSSRPQPRHSRPAKSPRLPRPCAANPATAAAPATHHPQSAREYFPLGSSRRRLIALRLEGLRPLSAHSPHSQSLSVRDPIWKINLNFRSPTFAIPNLKPATRIRIEPRNPLPRRRQSQSLRLLQVPSGRQPHAVIRHANLHSAIHSRRRNLHRPTTRPPRNSVPYRVFYQRLQKQRRNQCCPCFWRHCNLNRQMLSESNLLNRNIVLQKFHLFRQRHFLFVLRLQRQPQQIAQMLDHRPRQPWIALHLRRNRIQRVKKKMWIQLHPQNIQARFRKLLLQPRAP